MERPDRYKGIRRRQVSVGRIIMVMILLWVAALAVVIAVVHP